MMVLTIKVWVDMSKKMLYDLKEIYLGHMATWLVCIDESMVQRKSTPHSNEVST